jgi:hypothetical protein
MQFSAVSGPGGPGVAEQLPELLGLVDGVGDVVEDHAVAVFAGDVDLEASGLESPNAADAVIGAGESVKHWKVER